MRLAWVFLVPTLAGCYFIKQGIGQLSVGWKAQGVSEAATRLDDGGRRKLELIAEVKRFGEERIGLTPSRSYTTYFDTKNQPISWVVSGCRQDCFEEFVWYFPIVGALPYKAFFDLEDARAEARSMREKGYDVIVRGVQAYSTLGWFKDPIYSTFLELSKAGLVNLILHELTHGTVYGDGAEFNESLASFVAIEGGRQFLESDPVALQEFNDRAEDEVRFEEFIRRLKRELEALYASTLDKMKIREQVFVAAQAEFRVLRFRSREFAFFGEMSLNNAEIMSHVRYHRYPFWRAVFDRAGRQWSVFFDRVRAVAHRADPFRALEP